MAKPRFHTFLSHNSEDKPFVQELARKLHEQGFECWLDEWHLVPGEAWQPAIERALAECGTCCVFIGPSGIGPWQNAEMRAAIDRRVNDRDGFRVIPVLLPGTERPQRSELPTFLVATTWVEFRKTLDDKESLHRLTCGIEGKAPGPQPGPESRRAVRPYRGLEAFQPKHAQFFFGRKALTEWLVDDLRRKTESNTQNRFLAIVGASGSGKSSLARAGLVPAMTSGNLEGSDRWPVLICRPGPEPLESIAVALRADATVKEATPAPAELIRQLREDDKTLHLTTRTALHNSPDTDRVVLLVDQFEEIFTQCYDESVRKAAIDNLLYASSVAVGRTVVVLTMRADFYGRCGDYPDLATALSDHQVLVGPMTDEELRDAIERPAQRVGCEFEPGLVDTLIEAVRDQAGALPLLQYTLSELWTRRDGRRLTFAAYQDIGKLHGALEQRANAIYAAFSADERAICQRIFLRLTQLGEGSDDTKRRVPLEELLPADGDVVAVKKVLLQLAKERLLTTEGDPEDNRAVVEVAHEALIHHWPRLREWIELNRDALRIHDRLTMAAREWEDHDRHENYLYPEVRLPEIEEWEAEHGDEMAVFERTYFEASVRYRDKKVKDEELRRQRELDLLREVAESEQERAREQEKRAEAEKTRAEDAERHRQEQLQANARLRRILAVAVAFFFLASISAFIAVDQYRDAQDRFETADTTIDLLLEALGIETMVGTPGIDELLDVALQQSDELGKREEDPKVHAIVNFRKGFVARYRDREGAKALGFYRKALAQLEELGGKESDDPDVLEYLGMTLNESADIAKDELNDFGKAIKNYEAALEVRSKLVDVARPEDARKVDYQRRRANVKMNLSEARLRAGEHTLAQTRKDFEEVQTTREDLLAKAPAARDRTLVLYDRAHGYFLYGSVEEEYGTPSEAFGLYEKALTLYEEVRADLGGALQPRYYAALCNRQLGKLILEQHDVESAIDHYDKALSEMEIVVDFDPNVRDYRHELAWAKLHFGGLLLDEYQDVDTALFHFQSAEKTLHDLVTSGSVEDYEYDWLFARLQVGRAHTQKGEAQKAEVELAKLAKEIRNFTTTDGHRGVDKYQLLLLETLFERARTASHDSDGNTAIVQDFTHALSEVKDFVRDHPNVYEHRAVRGYLDLMNSALSDIAHVYGKANAAEAVDVFAEILTELRMWVSEYPNVVEYQEVLKEALRRLQDVYDQAQRAGDTVTVFNEIVTELRQHVDKHAGSGEVESQLQELLAHALTTFGDLRLTIAFDAHEALKWYSEAEGLLQALGEHNGSRFELCLVQLSIRDANIKAGRREDALKFLRESLPAIEATATAEGAETTVLVDALIGLGDLEMSPGENAQAALKSHLTAEELITGEPQPLDPYLYPYLSRDLCRARSGVARAYRKMGRDQEALAVMYRILSDLPEIKAIGLSTLPKIKDILDVRSDSEVDQYQEVLADILMGVGDLATMSSVHEAVCLQSYQDAETIMNRLTQRRPDNAYYAYKLGLAQVGISDAYKRANRAEEANSKLETLRTRVDEWTNRFRNYTYFATLRESVAQRLMEAE